MSNDSVWGEILHGVGQDIPGDGLNTIRQSMLPSLFAANYELLHVASEDAVFGTAPRTGADPALLRDGIAHIDAEVPTADTNRLFRTKESARESLAKAL